MPKGVNPAAFSFIALRGARWRLPLSRCGKRAGGTMVSSYSVSTGSLLRHHLKAGVDPSMQHILPSLQNWIVGVFKEWLHSVAHFSSLKEWPPFTRAALCLAPLWGGGSQGKSFLCLCVPASCLLPWLLALSSWCTCSSSMEADGGGGNLCTRRMPCPRREGNSWSPPLLSCANLMLLPRGGPCGPHRGGTPLKRACFGVQLH